MDRRKKFFAQPRLLATCILCILPAVLPDIILAQCSFDPTTTINIPSSFNPVGSGARALGMGGAFIALADDATAASWNPGGLTQLDVPEVSAVGAYLYRTENPSGGENANSEGSQDVSAFNLNFISAAYPFELFNRNMIVSLSYQHLFDFNRRLVIPIAGRIDEGLRVDGQARYEQSGDLYAVGLAYGIRLLSNLSVGVTLNFWEDFIEDNQWQTRTHEVATLTTGNALIETEVDFRERFTFRGFNFNVGLLWNVTQKLTLGAVFKSPFTADVKFRADIRSSAALAGLPPEGRQENFSIIEEDQNLDMPMSYGFGLAYRFSDRLIVSADLFRTHWDDFVLTDACGNETAPLSGLPSGDSDVDPTHQIRVGAEYLFVGANYVIPLRGGLFYDPAPAEGGPDEFFGLSIGTGIGLNRFTFDIAYQYRFGNDVGGSNFGDDDFSHDVHEHKVYASLVLYF